MKVIIVGAGLGGLACAIACRRQGFDVVIFDGVKEFFRLGDSIGLGSNSARLLYRWGVGEKMAPIASEAQEVKIYHFSNSDRLLGCDTQLAKAAETYGCRQLIGHRADFHMIMRDYAIELGADLRMGTRIEEYDTAKPSVKLATGEEVEADVVIIADGAKSKGRVAVLGYEDRPIHSGYAVYRSFANSDIFRDDPLVCKFLKDGEALRLFVAPHMHGFVTTLRGGKEINSVLTHKDVGDVEEDWSKGASNSEVLALLDGWDPAFKRVWEKMPIVIDWKLVYRPCLDKWVADTGLVALMGDAAHPFLPTSVQGASQAIEDGATIAKCLGKCNGDVPLAMETYFEIRHDYVAAAQETGITQREKWHLSQDEQTKSFKDNFDINNMSQGNLHLWANDAEKVVDEQWDRISQSILQRRSVYN